MKLKKITTAAVIAACYVVLTMISALFGLSGMAIQVRLSEALTILPFFTSAAVPGLFAGCLLANLLTGGVFIDVIGGSLITLAAAILTALLGKIAEAQPKTDTKPGKRSGRSRLGFLAPLPPVVLNTLLIPWILRYAYGIPGSIPFFMLTAGCGELISAGLLGTILFISITSHRTAFFRYLS